MKMNIFAMSLFWEKILNSNRVAAIDSRIKYNGEETKYKSFVANDTVKERYPKYHFLAI
jgi:hypothetical protein